MSRNEPGLMGHHACAPPSVFDNKLKPGQVWRCECGRKWKVCAGSWKRYRWPLPFKTHDRRVADKQQDSVYDGWDLD